MLYCPTVDDVYRTAKTFFHTTRYTYNKATHIVATARHTVHNTYNAAQQFQIVATATYVLKLEAQIIVSPITVPYRATKYVVETIVNSAKNTKLGAQAQYTIQSYKRTATELITTSQYIVHDMLHTLYNAFRYTKLYALPYDTFIILLTLTYDALPYKSTKHTVVRNWVLNTVDAGIDTLIHDNKYMHTTTPTHTTTIECAPIDSKVPLNAFGVVDDCMDCMTDDSIYAATKYSYSEKTNESYLWHNSKLVSPQNYTG